MTYSFHPAAESEYLEAVAFYEARRPGLGASFLVEFERTLESVCAAPHRFRVERLPDVRRAGLRRFPFAVLYRELSGGVQILAVAHHRRRPGYWLARR